MVLYWAEGTKTDNRLSVTNSDPSLLRLFMRWTERFLVATPEYTAHVIVHAANDEPAARSWWASE